MASFTFEVLADCDFAGIPLRRGMILVVRPGHAESPMTAHVELPPNYGMLLNLVADNAITSLDAFAELRRQLPSASSAVGPGPRRRSSKGRPGYLQLLR